MKYLLNQTELDELQTKADAFDTVREELDGIKSWAAEAARHPDPVFHGKVLREIAGLCEHGVESGISCLFCETDVKSVGERLSAASDTFRESLNTKDPYAARPAKRSDGWPTRADMSFWSDAEKAIQAAVEAVESAGASIALTDAVMLLGKARARVADHMEGKDGLPCNGKLRVKEYPATDEYPASTVAACVGHDEVPLVCSTCRKPMSGATDIMRVQGSDEQWHNACYDLEAVIAKIKLNASVALLPGRLVPEGDFSLELIDHAKQYDAYNVPPDNAK